MCLGRNEQGLVAANVDRLLVDLRNAAEWRSVRPINNQRRACLRTVHTPK